MEVKYFSCKDRSELDKVINFEGNNYADFDISIDVVGFVNLNPPLGPTGMDEDGFPIYPEDTRKPNLSDFLFNVVFLNDKKKELFSGFNAETPKTPFRKFLI